MSARRFKLVFDPLTGQFELQRRQIVVTNDGNTGGTLTAGTLSLPEGTSLEFNGGMTTKSDSEIVLAMGSELILLS